jgi:outer membrane protein insertion porin family
MFAQPGRELAASDSKKLAIDGTFVGRGWSALSSSYDTALWDNWIELRLPVVPSVLSLDGFVSAALVGGASGMLDVNAFTEGTTSYDSTMSLSNFAFSAGAGLRFIILQFPFRIYLAQKFVFDDAMNLKWTDTWQFVLSVTTSLN